MTNLNPHWRDNFYKRVLAPCTGCGRYFMALKSHANRGTFLWCEECRPARKREKDRDYYNRKQSAVRKEARRRARRAEG